MAAAASVLVSGGRVGAPLPPDGSASRSYCGRERSDGAPTGDEQSHLARGAPSDGPWGLELTTGDAAARAVAELAGRVTSDPLSETLYVDGQLALVDDMLLYSDRASMAHSLEVRVPFLDYRMVEWSATGSSWP